MSTSNDEDELTRVELDRLELGMAQWAVDERARSIVPCTTSRTSRVAADGGTMPLDGWSAPLPSGLSTTSSYRDRRQRSE